MKKITVTGYNLNNLTTHMIISIVDNYCTSWQTNNLKIMNIKWFFKIIIFLSLLKENWPEVTIHFGTERKNVVVTWQMLSRNAPIQRGGQSTTWEDLSSSWIVTSQMLKTKDW